jgi:hypothetical protein
MIIDNVALYIIEVLSPVLVVFLFFTSSLFERSYVKYSIFFIILLQVISVSIRAIDYNSDTWRYSNYIYGLAQAEGLQIFLVSKFEPYHLFLAWLSQDFQLWLILEGTIVFFCLVYLIKKIERLEVLAILLGTTIPLFSSSMRYASSLLIISCFLFYLKKTRYKFFLLSVVGGATHISTIVAGVFEKRKPLLIFLLLIVFVYISNMSAETLQRVGASKEYPGQGFGLRAILPLLLFLSYLSVIRAGNLKVVLTDFLIITFVFVVILMSYTILTRWLILFLIIIAISSQDLIKMKAGRLSESMAASLLYLFLTGPFTLGILELVLTGGGMEEW